MQSHNSGSAQTSSFADRLILKIGVNNEGKKEEDKGKKEGNDSLRDGSASVIRLSIPSLCFSSLCSAANMDSRRYEGMKKYFDDLIDRLASARGDWVVISSKQERKIYDSFHTVIELMLNKGWMQVKDGGAYRFGTEDAYCRSYRLVTEETPTVSIEQVNLAEIAKQTRGKTGKDSEPNETRLKYVYRLHTQLEFDFERCGNDLKIGPDIHRVLGLYHSLVKGNATTKEIDACLEELSEAVPSKSELRNLFWFLNCLAERHYNISRSKSCSRVFSIYTQVASRWRKYLKWQSHQLKDFDISSCHALIWVSQYATGKEKEVLTKAVETGFFYDLFVSKEHSRSEIKLGFQKWMNGDRLTLRRIPAGEGFVTVKEQKENHWLHNVVAERFPNFADAISNIPVCGKKSRSAFANQLMGFEAGIMTKEMIDWAKDNAIVYYPIHDGWLTVEWQKEQVKNKVAELWQKHTGIKPYITEE